MRLKNQELLRATRPSHAVATPAARAYPPQPRPSGLCPTACPSATRAGPLQARPCGARTLRNAAHGWAGSEEAGSKSILHFTCLPLALP